MPLPPVLPPPPLRLLEPQEPAPILPTPPSPTEEQAAVIAAQQGTFLVLAAVGSGKTTTLSQRIARAIEQGIRPERILALTFTNRAAEQMRQSLGSVVGPPVARRVGLGTFHALCHRILQGAPAAAGLDPDFRILDEEDVREILETLGVDQPMAAWGRLQEAAARVPLGEARLADWREARLLGEGWFKDYVEALTWQGAVDFVGLVFLARALLTEHQDSKDRWSQACDLVQVDEVQDTHLSEYEVIRVLANRARSLCLVGDLDQTIYSWRGSNPSALILQLERDFHPVERLNLTTNFRCTARIVALADALAATLADRASSMQPHAGAPAGHAPTLTRFPGVHSEHRALADRIATLISRGTAPDRIGVLVRQNKEAAIIASLLGSRGIPCATTEHFKLFRRREVKDALALARLVGDPQDEPAALRVARGLVQGVSRATVERIQREAAPLGLRLGDFLSGPVVQRGDPFASLLSGSDFVVLDTETTGLDEAEDEVIEVAAVRVRNGRFSGDPADTFEALLRVPTPVGASEAVHHISDRMLAERGRPPHEVWTALGAFLGDLPVVGHNIGFDLSMIRASSARHGAPLRPRTGFDTLRFARRLLRLPNHRLGTLVAALQLPAQATHRAIDDVLATVHLIAALAERAAVHAHERRMLLLRESPLFARLRARLDTWAEADLRPAALIERIAEEAIRPKLPKDEWTRRAPHVQELAARVRRMDRPELSPAEALRKVLDRAALAPDAEDAGPRVRVLTMHQSKGLEFDQVFLPGLTEGNLPSYQALRDEDVPALEEERRVFYVALTRARLGLHLSCATLNDRQRTTEPSRFLLPLRPHLRLLPTPIDNPSPSGEAEIP